MALRIVEVYEEAGRTLTLRDRDGHLDLVLGNVPLLTSRALGTEHGFGALAARGLPDATRAVVVGGLGFGATLRGVLSVVPAGTRVVVVEKLAAVLRIAETHGKHLVGDVLSDPRVVLENADVVDVIARETSLAAILLDVDNGPGWASFRPNARLYAPPGLAKARSALGPGGVYAVWSGYEEASFVGALRRAGFSPEVVPLHEKGTLAARAYLGKNP